jgi:hypothetical protein
VREDISKERIKSVKISNKTDYKTVVQRDTTPGPGNYHKPDDFGKNTPGFSIKGRTSYRNNDLTPGPGSYDARDSLVKAFTPTYK